MMLANIIYASGSHLTISGDIVWVTEFAEHKIYGRIGKKEGRERQEAQVMDGSWCHDKRFGFFFFILGGR